MRVRRIFRNTVFSLAGHGIGDLCSLIFLAVLARAYGSDILGEFWFAMALGAILGTLVTRGTRPLILRDASQRLDMTTKYVGAAAGMQLAIATGLFLVLVAASAMIASTPRAQAILVIIVLYQIGYVLASVFRISFNAREEMHFNALLESGHKIMILVAGVAVLLLVDNPSTVLIVYPAAALAMYAAGYVLVSRRYGRPEIRLDWKLNLHWTTAAFPVFAYIVLKVLANRSGVIILNSATDAETVGIFAAGDRLISACNLPFAMLTGAVFPIMSKLATRRDELRSFVQTCLRVSAAIAIPLAALAVILREPVVAFVFGEGFDDSAIVVGVLALGIVFTAISLLLSMLLIATDHLWPLLRIYAVSLVVLFAGIYATVQSMGAVGLAWSVVASKAVLSLGLLLYSHRDPLGISGFRSIFGASMTAVSMVLVFQSLPMLGIGARSILMLLAGIIVLALFRGIELRDVHRLRQAIGI